MTDNIKEMPQIIKSFIKALSDNNRQKILMLLYNESNAKSFTEIRRALKVPKNSLSYHLKSLIKYGLIYNFYEKNKIVNKYSYYEISKLGNKFLNSIFYFDMEKITNKSSEFTSESQSSYLSTNEIESYEKKITLQSSSIIEIKPPLTVEMNMNNEEKCKYEQLEKERKNLVINYIW